MMLLCCYYYAAIVHRTNKPTATHTIAHFFFAFCCVWFFFCFLFFHYYYAILCNLCKLEYVGVRIVQSMHMYIPIMYSNALVSKHYYWICSIGREWAEWALVARMQTNSLCLHKHAAFMHNDNHTPDVCKPYESDKDLTDAKNGPEFRIALLLIYNAMPHANEMEISMLYT